MFSTLGLLQSLLLSCYVKTHHSCGLLNTPRPSSCSNRLFLLHLALPDFTLPFHIEIDACATGIGVVLTQNGHPLAYVSKALGVKNQELSTYENEYLVILIAIDQWSPYFLQG
jgi:hypothetical protein